ncbi:MAG: AAA family ATPase [Balneolaceae bacterium]
MISDTLFHFLNNPESYPHKPDHVKHIQTHISHVFIAPPYVYKMKKPVDFGFLDFSTLEKRKYYCKKEIELNRRLCSDIYIKVVGLVKKNDTYVLEPDHPERFETVEFAVKMKQLPRENFLIGLAKNGKLEMCHLEPVADKLVSFYKNQKPDEKILHFGMPESIRINTDENFEQTKSFIGNTIDESVFNLIRKFTDRFLNKGKKIFEQRVREKRIVDGHGDLHLEHINLTGGKVCIYDCIEFNDRFRYQDIAADLAFLAMDLDFYQYQRESRDFVRLMSDKLDDPGLNRMIDFYKCYRAYVRGKVKSIESSEEEVPEKDRLRAKSKATKHFQLALYYALLGSEPVIIIFMGRVASGKSTLAQKLSEKLGICHFMTDKIRKEIAGLQSAVRLPDEKRDKLYQPEISNETYGKLIESGKKKIQNGESVILDGTFSQAGRRKQMISDFNESGIRYLFVETTAADEVRVKRLLNRKKKKKVISDARLEDMAMLDERYNPPEEISADNLIRVNTGMTEEECLDHIFGELLKNHLSRIVST